MQAARVDHGARCRVRQRGTAAYYGAFWLTAAATARGTRPAAANGAIRRVDAASAAINPLGACAAAACE